jgi:Tol biopolymer transport system component
MLAAGTRFGGYEIQSPLGAGGMGEVYRARDVRLRRDVAIKVLPESVALDRERIDRFEREAHLLAALNHPNIATLYGIEEANGATALVMELVDGPTLADRLHSGAMPIREALTIARQIADALDAAHEKGIVHRDLKPANIKITPDGVVKVLDFGLAKGVEESSVEDLANSPTVTAHGTRTGVILGTAAYMSPEQTRGAAVDKRTDVWAFGCVLYEMLAGSHAFTGDTVSDLIAAIIHTEPRWDALPRATPPVARRLLSRLLEKDPKRRLRDIGDVRFDIDEALAGRSTIAPAAVGSSARAWPRTVMTLLAVAAGLLALVAAFVLWRPAPRLGEAIGQTTVSQLTNYGGTEGAGALSPDGRSFAFVSDHGGASDIWVRQVAGGEPVRVTDDAAVESDLVYAPDGETIYFTKTEGPVRSIWRIGAIGGQPRKVLNNAVAPSPSPDGRRLAWFEPQPGPALSYALVVGATDGGNKKILVERVLVVTVLGRAAWSPDGRSLAYSSGTLFAPRNLFVVNVEDGRSRQATRLMHSTEAISTQAWLADGRRVVVAYIPADHMFVHDLAVVDIETGTLTRLIANLTDSFNTPSVSADGKRIVVTASRTQREVWKVPFGPDPEANGRAAVRVMDSTQDPMWIYVTRDGRTLLFNNALAGSRNLWTMPLEGNAKPRQITTVPGEAIMHSSLSPDGTHVAFVSSATGNSNLWVQNVDGSDLRQLTDDAAAESWPVWSPDGERILYGALRDGRFESRVVPAGGGTPEKIADEFFRGDWIRKPDGSGTWIVSSNSGGGLRLVDFERRSVIWQDRRPGNAMPMFSPDGRSIAIAYTETRDRDAIWVYDVATGKGRVAVRFPQPFQIIFRTSWVDDGRAFVVNRGQAISHIVMLDRFGASSASTER